MWVYDTETLCFLDANAAAVKLYGYSRAEFLKMHLSDIVNGDQDARKKAAGPARQRKPAAIGHCTKNGTLIHVQTSSKRITYHGHKAALAEIKQVLGKTQTDQYFRTLLDDTPDSIVVINPGGKIVLVNKQTEKLFGYTREELLGKGMESLVPQRLRSKHRLHRGDYSRKPRVRQMGVGLELRGLTKDGSEFPVEISLSPVQTEDGLLIMAAIRDITDKKQTEAALARSETNYRDLVDHTQLLMCTHDLQGNLLSINPWATKVLGYEAKDLIGRNIREFLAPETRARFSRYLVNIRKHGVAQGVMQVITASGEQRFWEYHNTLRTEDVAEPLVRGTAYDITERKAAEEGLRRSEAMFRGLFESVLDGIFRTTPDGRILSASPALVHMLGYQTEDELLSINVGSLYFDPQVRERTKRILKKTGELRNVEIELKRGDGRPLAVLENSRRSRTQKAR